MTEAEFLETLAARTRETGTRWKIDEMTAIRTVDAVCLNGTCGCPLVWLATLDSGNRFRSNYSGLSAALGLGISAEVAARIMYAADSDENEGALRAALLAACGLTAVEV